MNIYERHCTFEGPEYFSEASNLLYYINSLSKRFSIITNIRTDRKNDISS